MFQWPQGIVVGNLIASAITGFFTYLKIHRKLNKHNRQLHEKLDAQHQWHLDKDANANGG